MLLSLIAYGDQLFPGQAFMWPEPLAYLWAVMVLLGAVAQFLVLLMDSQDVNRERIWILAKVNLAIWAFSPFLWLYIGALSMLIVTVFGIMGCIYIGLAKKFNEQYHRI